MLQWSYHPQKGLNQMPETTPLFQTQTTYTFAEYRRYSRALQNKVMHRPLVIGHRGDIYAPENSLEGIESAALRGADYAEIDIQLTADGELAVFHDSSTSRLCERDLTDRKSVV